MCNYLKIKCPSTDMTKTERINTIFNIEFKKWITNPTLIEVVRVFDVDFSFDDNESLISLLTRMKKFVVENWDYRKKQKDAQTREGEAARWLLQSEEIIDKNSKLILECAQKLGLIGNDKTYLDYIDYILPLGGARMSNLRRCELARNIVDELNLSGLNIVALSGMRPLADSEMENCIDTYAENARYEFQAISKGLEQAFDILDRFSEQKYEDKNPNANYVIREYEQSYNDNKIFSVAAPSTQPEIRRANSADCFKFLFENFSIPSGSRILNCTSQIYCSYQQVKALTYSLKYNVVFDTVGFPFALNTPGIKYGMQDKDLLSKPVNYLQEIKATIDAMYEFMSEFYNSDNKG